MVTNNALEDKMGGHERYVRELASVLSRRGHDVSIVAKRWSGESPRREVRPDGVIIERHSVPSKGNPLYAPLYPAFLLKGIAQGVHRKSSGSVIHVHMGLQALGLAAASQPYVFTFHAPVWRELLAERQGSYALPGAAQAGAVRLLRSVEGFTAKRASFTVVLSEFMRQELALLNRSAAERSMVIPGGIDERRFSPDRSIQLPADARPPLLFTARRLTPRTGVDELIRAMPSISNSFPGVQLKIAGTGAQEPDLRALAARVGPDEGAIEFLGRISDEELVRWYRRASLVVLPTRELEGFGLTTAEALACGAAVIGTPAGATPELLAPLDPVLLAKDNAAPSIAASVKAVLDDPRRLGRIRASAERRIMPALGWEAVADRYLEIYQRLSR